MTTTAMRVITIAAETNPTPNLIQIMMTVIAMRVTTVAVEINPTPTHIQTEIVLR